MKPRGTTYDDRGPSWMRRIVVAADGSPASTQGAWEFIVRDGSPGGEVVKVVEEIGADLVVVGSNRHSSLHNLLLGSTAAYLTAHSPAPVLVMRSKAVSSIKPVAAEAAQ